MKKGIIGILLFIFSAQSLNGQISPYTSNYRFNPILLNPALAGVDSGFTAVASHASQQA
jgi:hypothetical protein